MISSYAVIALDIAERVREADEYRLVASARNRRPKTPGLVRRTTAVALASVSSGAASLARRLDSRVADRLGPDRLATNN
jgi:hypothetical protein